MDSVYIPIKLESAPAIGGMVPYSSVDWPGVLCAVVFISGCPWRCSYCHNPHLQDRHHTMRWTDITDFLAQRSGLLEGVVFSGGEPCSEPQLDSMIRTVRQMGFKVGLHTAGIYPARLARILPVLDWIGLDIKAPEGRYDDITGRKHSSLSALTSLELLLNSDVPFECRTTWDRALFDEQALCQLGSDLAQRGVKAFSLQYMRHYNWARAGQALSSDMLNQLAQQFTHFTVRQ
ncbi:anaerobic ribonucleoside-triphosphate reductase activating protein [Burkholderiaceae bacterium DAT-1]|nr:anaerobic ribonucleoside-triphosphate reductase activating protein [Burkholderiaceae bacterium DAT-1]